MNILIFLLLCSSPVFADAIRAPLKFLTNTVADYTFVRPVPGDTGESIFKMLCTSTPPGCEKKHPAPGIPIACAISPQYKEIEQEFHILFKRAENFSPMKDSIAVDELFLSGPNKQANEAPVAKPGQIIAWKWNANIKEKLQDYLGSLEKDKTIADVRMQGFEYRMINDLKHEKYHVEMHFIPYFSSLEKLFNGIEKSDWRRKKWIVKHGDPIPGEQIHKSMQEYIGKNLRLLEKKRQDEIDKFHQQQDSYSNHARMCACYGDTDACTRMKTFRSY